MSAPREVSLETLHDFPLPSLAQVGDKEGRGRVLAIGGGAQVSGAIALTGVAALRAGAGKLQMATVAAAAIGLGIAVPEAAVLALSEGEDGEIAPGAADRLASAVSRADAVVVGPGMIDETSAGALAVALAAAADGAAFVLDAAAMTGVDLGAGSILGLSGRLVLTPHAGEMARLTGLDKSTVEAEPLAAARSISRAANAMVVMKGAETFIVSPDGAAWRHGGGVVGLATSGSGDVLAGIIAGLLARGASPLVASVWGVCVHGACGARLGETIAPLGFLARELLAEIPGVIASVRSQAGP